jgi:hypothetical protein
MRRDLSKKVCIGVVSPVIDGCDTGSGCLVVPRAACTDSRDARPEPRLSRRAFPETRQSGPSPAAFDRRHSTMAPDLAAAQHYQIRDMIRSRELYDVQMASSSRYLEEAYEWREERLAEEDHSQLASEHELARAYLNDRRIKEAIEMLEHVVAAQKRTLDCCQRRDWHMRCARGLRRAFPSRLIYSATSTFA